MLLPKFLSRKKLSRKYRSIFASKISPATGVRNRDFLPEQIKSCDRRYWRDLVEMKNPTRLSNKTTAA